MKFTVIDLQTGKEPDVEQIALKEDWAKGLVYCDIEGFSILEDGTLYLLDECGNYAYCPGDRFKIVFERPPSLDVVGDYNYWKRRCEAAEKLLNNILRGEHLALDPETQYDLYHKWNYIVKEMNNQ